MPVGGGGVHIEIMTKKASQKLNVLRSLKFSLGRQTLQILYFSFIRPTLEYGDIIWNNCPAYLKDRLEKVNIESARIVTVTIVTICYQKAHILHRCQIYCISR